MIKKIDMVKEYTVTPTFSELIKAHTSYMTTVARYIDVYGYNDDISKENDWADFELEVHKKLLDFLKKYKK